MSDKCIYCGDKAHITFGAGTRFEYSVCGRCPGSLDVKPKRKRKQRVCKFCLYNGQLKEIAKPEGMPPYYLECPICGGIWHTHDDSVAVEPGLSGHLRALRYYATKPLIAVVEGMVKMASDLNESIRKSE